MDRNAFFKTSEIPYAETLQASFEVEESLKFTIHRSIVKFIIGRLLFHEDDQFEVSYERAMMIFENKDGVFVIEEKRPSRFRLCVEYMSAGVTFRMAAKIMQATKKETGISRLGGCSAAVAARYARIVCAASLELLSQLISETWGFSLALDCATHQSKSYVDVRCRFSVGAELHNFHLLAIPLFDRHTAVNIFSVLEQFLDALIPKWRCQLLGVATDGAATMVGNTSGVTTLMEQECEYEIVRVWCGLHQLDLKMQVVFEQALNEDYISKLTGLISYLRRQQNLITKMRTTCPTVANTRWLSMFQVAHWLCENAFAIRNYLHTKTATCAPNSVWWIFLFALREVAREANAVFISLQGLTTLVKQQQDRFEGLVFKLCSNSGMLGPLEPGELYLTLAAYAHVTSLDLWVCDSLAELPTEQKQAVIVAVARTYVLMANGIDDLVVAKTTAYPVTPKELCVTSMPQFSEIIKSLRPRLGDALGEAQINTVAAELRALHKYHADSKPFRDEMAAFDHRLATFDSIWLLGGAGLRFPHLAAFCGTLASVFPNTATVESDFSIIVCEKDDKRTCLTDLSLEGVLHCKQWQRLTSIKPANRGGSY